MTAVTDDLGRIVTPRVPVRRLVSLVPSLTEAVFALGSGAAVCGATRYCVEPAGAVDHVARVGGTKNPDVARIVELAPDVVLANPEENRREDVAALEAAGLTVFVSFPQRVADVPRLFRQLGVLLAVTEAAERAARAVEAVLDRARTWAPEPRPRVFCPIWKNPWMTVNGDTFVSDVLWCAGGVNVCRDLPERFPRVTLEAVAELAPEVVLLPDEPYVFSARDLPALAPLAATPALRSGRVHFVDGKALCWYGPRTAEAVLRFHALLTGGGPPG